MSVTVLFFTDAGSKSSVLKVKTSSSFPPIRGSDEKSLFLKSTKKKQKKKNSMFEKLENHT